MLDDVPSLVLTQRAQVSKPLFAYFFAVLWIGVGSAVLFFLLVAPIVGQEKVEYVFDFSDDLNLVLHPVSDENRVVCGNGHCESSETVQTCFIDCFVCNNNGACESELGENQNSCPADCVPAPVCNNNGSCETGENRSNCPADCVSKFSSSCGDHSCSGTESCSSCPGDCGSCPFSCGDGVCGETENCQNCPSDCGGCPAVCGDGSCNGSENCSSCPSDCGSCVCSPGQNRPCVVSNSFGTCSGTENCVNNLWGACNAATPVAEICGDGLDNDCDGVLDENCDCVGSADCSIPGWQKMKSMWFGWKDTDASRDQALATGFNTLIPNYGGFQGYENGWRPDVLPLIQHVAAYAKQHNVWMVPTFKTSWPWDAESGFGRGIYWDSVSNTMKESLLVAPLDRKYWQNMTATVKRVAQLQADNPALYRVDGLFIDFELYDSYGEYWTYYNDQNGSFDDETFNEFVATLENPPSPLPSWQERRNWVAQNNLLSQYLLFVRQKGQGLAQQMAKEAYSVNPNFFIGSYQSPGWDASRNRYRMPLFLDFFKGWAYKHVPVIFSTDMYGAGGAGNIPPELKPTGKDYFRFERKDNNENVYAYYAGGFLVDNFDSKYGKWNVETDVYGVAQQTNGYWLFINDMLIGACADHAEGSRLRTNCANEPLVEEPNYNCCYNQNLMEQDNWVSQCCPYFDTAVQDYWGSLQKINGQLG